MNPTVAVRYIDAVYFLKGEKIPTEDFKFAVHVAIGKANSFDDHIILSFTWDKKNNPKEGLLLPRSALLLENKPVHNFLETIKFLKVNTIVGVYWKDIVYFENTAVPKESTTMYTEGKISWISNDAIGIENPKTIKIKEEMSNHPRDEVIFCIIPKSLITNLDIYD
jgi:hypothetical protein